MGAIHEEFEEMQSIVNDGDKKYTKADQDFYYNESLRALRFMESYIIKRYKACCSVSKKAENYRFPAHMSNNQILEAYADGFRQIKYAYNKTVQYYAALYFTDSLKN